jgi:peptide/nickel transport system ATP-binding protein
MQGRASDPAAWPAPFTLDGSDGVDMIHLGGGHYVRAQKSQFAGAEAGSSREA